MLQDLKKTIEEIAFKKIFSKYPEAMEYKLLISFNHVGNKASINLDQLPADLMKKIALLFE
ncbi:MAG: hypothetical protein ABJB86_10520 [Bacteroidota bacterium]